MSSSPTPQIFPAKLLEGLDENTRQAIRYAFNGILDLQRAIPDLNTKVNGMITAVAPVTTPVIAGGGGSIATSVGTVNFQSGTAYTLQQSDYGALIAFDNAGTTTLTLNSGLVMPLFAFVGNYGTAGITLSASAGSLTGPASIAPSQIGIVFFDGQNWWSLSPLITMPLTGVSASLGGSAMTVGQTIKITVTIPTATTSMVAICSPNTYPGDGFIWYAQVTGANTVTVYLTAIIVGTPAASTYNVRVVQ